MAEPIYRNGCGEREEIGRIRKASRFAANLVERFDPEGCKNPEGERRSEKQRTKLVAGFATGLKR